MITLEKVSVHYGDHLALDRISLHIGRGESVLVTGPSGCGKSTLARLLAGIIPHAVPARVEGKVITAGIEGLAHSIPEIAQKVGVVFQNPSSQLFHLKVKDEVAFGPRNLGFPEEEVQRRTWWALRAVGIADFSEHNPANLSGGQKQRVAIAAALAMKPVILVLDEPTASLDVPGTRQVLDTLIELRQQHGVTIVLIEHRLAEVAQTIDRVIILNEGRIAADGLPSMVLNDRVILRSLGLRRPIDNALTPWQTLVSLPVEPDPHLQPLIEFRNVSAGYNHHPVIHDIQLALFPGEFVALVGDNGAGKSTLGLAAAGLIKPASGQLVYPDGKRLKPGRDVSILFQNPSDQLFTDSVDEEVAFGPHNFKVFEADRHEEILQEADLAGLRLRRPTELSVGQQQRTALAACLALNPRLIVLDEPTLGQDWGHLQRLMDFLTVLNERGATILLITHDYKLVHRYARRVLIMQNGRIISDGSVAGNQPATNPIDRQAVAIPSLQNIQAVA